MYKSNNKLLSPETNLQEFARIFDADAFREALKNTIKEGEGETPEIISVTIPYEKTDALAVLEILSKPGEFQFYWEYPDEKLAIAAGKSIKQLKAEGSNRFRNLSECISEQKNKIIELSDFNHSLSGVHFLGGFGFFDHKVKEGWEAFGASAFVIPEWTFIRDGELSLLTLNLKLNEKVDADDAQSNVFSKLYNLNLTIQKSIRRKNGLFADTKQLDISIEDGKDELSEWVTNVNKAKGFIRSGSHNKVVLSRRLKVKTSESIEPTKLVNQLRKEYPSCYSFLFRPDGKHSFVGSTPERLLSVRSKYILTEGLAGSISRGGTATQDTILERQLLNSKKDNEEHFYVVRSIIRRLEMFSDEINYPSKPGIKKFTNVQHLYTPVSAWMNADHDPFEILEKLHPTPAVGGSPSEKALELIPLLEQHERGWYAGPVGWITSKGRGEFVVAIRSGLIMEDSADFFAGCGIVEDSDPILEWEETKLKLIPMLSAIKHG